VTSFTAGQVLDVTDARAMATAGLGEVVEALAGGDGERVVVTPSGSTLSLPAGESPHFLNLDERGIYEVRVPGGSYLRSVAVAVNVDPREADLEPLDVEAMLASMMSAAPLDASVASEGGQGARLRLEDQERRQSLWRYLLLVVVVVLGLETLISKRMSRTTGERGMYAGT
jgi:hypothetical protein